MGKKKVFKTMKMVIKRDKNVEIVQQKHHRGSHFDTFTCMYEFIICYFIYLQKDGIMVSVNIT